MAGLTSALILGGTALAGAAINASAANNAAKTTSQAAQKASSDAMAAAIAAGKSQIEAAQIAADAARATAEGNNKLLREIYDQNKMVLQPSMQTGTAAQDAINAFLGLPVYKTVNDPIYADRMVEAPDYEAYVNNNPDIKATYDQYGQDFGSVADFGEWYANHPELGGVNQRDVPMRQVSSGDQQITGYNTRQELDAEAPQRQREAFDRFRDATGYQFQLDQGVKALDQSAAARGLLNSGKAVKSVQKYGSDLASQSAGQYLNYLANQQGVGSSAINALAGMGNVLGQGITANNTNATNAANSALLGATTSANNALLDATGTAGRLGMGAADTGAQAGLVGAGSVSNLLGQAVSAYGNYRGTSSYARPAPYETPSPSYWTPPTNPGYGLNTDFV